MTLKVKTFTYLDKQNTQYALTNVPVFLYAVTLLIFRLKQLFQVKNGLTTSLRFFLNAQNLGQSDDAKRRKKRGWP